MTDSHLALFELIDSTSAASAEMMTRVVDKTRENMDMELRMARENASRDDLIAVFDLPVHRAGLGERMPKILREEFLKALKGIDESSDRHVQIDFESLELLDETAMQKSLEMTRGIQSCGIKTDVELADLNSLVCAALGMENVLLERNPFRPEIYLRAVLRNFEASGAVESMVSAWFKRVGSALGDELKLIYPEMAKELRERGVKRASFVVTPQAEAPGGASPATPASPAETATATPLSPPVAMAEPMPMPMPMATSAPGATMQWAQVAPPRWRTAQPLVQFGSSGAAVGTEYMLPPMSASYGLPQGGQGGGYAVVPGGVQPMGYGVPGDGQNMGYGAPQPGQGMGYGMAPGTAVPGYGYGGGGGMGGGGGGMGGGGESTAPGSFYGTVPQTPLMPDGNPQRVVLTLEQLQWLLAAPPADTPGAYTSWTGSTEGGALGGGESTLSAGLSTHGMGLTTGAGSGFYTTGSVYTGTGVPHSGSVDLDTGMSAAAALDQQAMVAARAQQLAADVSLEKLLANEVVMLLLENVVNDGRILKPVRQLVRALEPALRKLSQVEPKFFNAVDHPARALLENITYRSFAYPNELAPGFKSFVDHLNDKIHRLLAGPIDDAEPFRKALAELESDWTRQEEEARRARTEAVTALQRAEERNVLAAEIADRIMARTDIAAAPNVIVNFLCGAWSQVLAHARMTGMGEDFEGIVKTLLWSVDIEAAHKDMPGLLKAIPKLSATIGNGLSAIEYPQASTDAFLKELSALHRRVLLERQRKPSDKPAPVEKPVKREPPAVRGMWLAPSERKLAGLVNPSPSDPKTRRSPRPPSDGGTDTQPQGIDDTLQAGADSRPGAAHTVPLQFPAVAPATTSPGSITPQTIPGSVDAPPRAPMPTLGAWFEVQENGQRYRAQLTWASPKSTLFLFIKADGTSLSMTRRIYDRKVDEKSLTLVSGKPVVADALDAVTTLAKQNSDKGFGGMKDMAIV